MIVPQAAATSLLLLLGLATSSSALAGQSALRGPTASVLTSTTPGPLRAVVFGEPGDSVDRDIRPTHWKEGALVGGLIGATGGALLGAAICRNSEVADKSCGGTPVVSGLIVGLVLAIPGALIGGQIPKGGPTE